MQASNWTVRLHRLLGIGLAVFVVTHLAVHVSAVFGIDTHVALLRGTQKAYRNPIVEPMLLAGLAAQGAFGMRLGWERRRAARNHRLVRMQLVSGFYLTWFFVIHASAALLPRLHFHLETNFYWVAGPLQHPVARWFFYPYYGFAILAVFTHAAVALRLRAKRLVWARLVQGGGVVVAVSILLAFGGALFPIAIPAPYQTYLGALLSTVGL